jgi:hypothetical protein
MAIPMRPWVRTRMNGHWMTRGVRPGKSIDLKAFSSKARVRWVKTTRMEARPRRPYKIVLAGAELRDWRRADLWKGAG